MELDIGFSDFGFKFPIVLRRASAGRTDKSTRTCLSPAAASAKAGRVSARSGRRKKRDKGVFFWFVFLPRGRK
jgi:hypothetical protein